MATWTDVGRIAASLPETVESSSSQRGRGWSVKDKAIAWERPLRPADVKALGDRAPTGAILCVRVPDEGVKQALVTDEPDVYFTTPHFNGYPAVLVRLGKVKVADLRELLTEAWLCRAPKRLIVQHPELAAPDVSRG